MSKNHLVAVYGTLMIGEANHFLMERIKAKYLGHDVLTGISLYDLGDYPAAKFNKDGVTFVQVFAIDSDGLAILDLLEGYQGDPKTDHYVRRKIKTCHGGTWIYIYNRSVEGREERVRWFKDAMRL